MYMRYQRQRLVHIPLNESRRMINDFVCIRPKPYHRARMTASYIIL